MVFLLLASLAFADASDSSFILAESVPVPTMPETKSLNRCAPGMGLVWGKNWTSDSLCSCKSLPEYYRSTSLASAARCKVTDCTVNCPGVFKIASTAHSSNASFAAPSDCHHQDPVLTDLVIQPTSAHSLRFNFTAVVGSKIQPITILITTAQPPTGPFAAPLSPPGHAFFRRRFAGVTADGGEGGDGDSDEEGRGMGGIGGAARTTFFPVPTASTSTTVQAARDMAEADGFVMEVADHLHTSGAASADAAEAADRALPGTLPPSHPLVVHHHVVVDHMVDEVGVVPRGQPTPSTEGVSAADAAEGDAATHRPSAHPVIVSAPSRRGWERPPRPLLPSAAEEVARAAARSPLGGGGSGSGSGSAGLDLDILLRASLPTSLSPAVVQEATARREAMQAVRAGSLRLRCTPCEPCWLPVAVVGVVVEAEICPPLRAAALRLSLRSPSAPKLSIGTSVNAPGREGAATAVVVLPPTAGFLPRHAVLTVTQIRMVGGVVGGVVAMVGLLLACLLRYKGGWFVRQKEVVEFAEGCGERGRSTRHSRSALVKPDGSGGGAGERYREAGLSDVLVVAQSRAKDASLLSASDRTRASRESGVRHVAAPPPQRISDLVRRAARGDRERSARAGGRSRSASNSTYAAGESGRRPGHRDVSAEPRSATTRAPGDAEGGVGGLSLLHRSPVVTLHTPCPAVEGVCALQNERHATSQLRAACNAAGAEASICPPAFATASRWIRARVPGFSRLVNYSVRHDLPGDVTAGLSIGLMVVPQALAYAAIAGVPPANGLFSAATGLGVYAFLGSSNVVTVGPTAVMSLLVANSAGLDGSEPLSHQWVANALSLSLMSGLIQFLWGSAGLGFVIHVIPRPVLLAFVTAAALTIAAEQVPKLLGIRHVPRGLVPAVFGPDGCVARFEEATTSDISVAVVCFVALLALQYVRRVKPFQRSRSVFYLSIARNAVVVAVAALAVWLLKLNVETSAPLTATLQLPSLPSFPKHLFIPSIVVAMVGFLEDFSIAKAFQHTPGAESRVAASQELIALGAANVFGSLFGAYPVTGSFSRTAVNATSGVRTPFSGFVVGVIVVFSLYALGPLFRWIPSAALASMIVAAVLQMLDFAAMRVLFRSSPLDFTIFVICVCVGIFSSLTVCIIVGAALGVSVFLYSALRPGAVAARVGGGIGVVCVPTSLSFLGLDTLVDAVESLCSGGNPLHGVVFGCAEMPSIDDAAALGLCEMVHDLGSRKPPCSVVFAAPSEAVMLKLRAAAAAMTEGVEVVAARSTSAAIALLEADRESVAGGAGAGAYGSINGDEA